MKSDFLLKRIQLARESNVQGLLPWDSYLERIRAADSLLNFVESEGAKPEIIQQARWYFIITLVSIMEIYFRGMAEIFLQGGWFKDTFIGYINQDKISLADLIKLDREKTELHELIPMFHSFENLDSINDFYGKMIGCNNFLKEVSEYKAPIGKGQYQLLKEKHPHFDKDIGELLHFRHLIIHHDASKRTISDEKLDKMTKSLIDFLYAVDLYLFDVSEGYTEKQTK